jgi:hypothetical protein
MMKPGRTMRTAPTAAFAFGEMQNADLVGADWSPQFADHFYVAFTNATAFSPTDAPPITRW